MPDCKSCGQWFASSRPDELCSTCERALERLGKYVAPVRHGRWEDAGGGYVACSECGEEHSWIDYRAPYCENCGAKMDLED